MVYIPIDKQVFLHPETVCAAITTSTVAVGTPGGTRLSGICRWILVVTVQIRQISTFTS